MKLKFDSNQQYQIDAINSIVDIFDGQPINRGDFEVALQFQGDALFSSQIQTELGVGNNLLINEEAILNNIKIIQEKNDIDISEKLIAGGVKYNFSVEMETGTGKTYVYLRTIFELNQKYEFKKFIIVVPGVATREGTLKNLEITKDHFKSLYNNAEFEHFVYDAKKINRLRQFATSNQIWL